MKAKELRDLSDDELEDRLSDTRRELFNLRFQATTGSLEDTTRLRAVKRDVARLLTLQNERRRQAETRT